MERVLVIDDDQMTLVIVSKILQGAGYSVETNSDPAAALDAYRPGDFNLVMTDFYMPDMNGQQVVERIRAVDPQRPVIILTASMDLATTVELFKNGATDYSVKPVIPEDLLHRVRSVIDEANLRLEVLRIEQEKRLIELESQKLVNWRMLYAYKDISQTERMINLLTRTINAEGGFAWLDLLDDLPHRPDGGVELDKDTLDLIRNAANGQRAIYEYLGFISKLPKLKMDIKALPARQLVVPVAEYAHGELSAICGRHGHGLAVHVQTVDFDGLVSADVDMVRKVCKELVINAVKYSPPMSRVIFEIEHGSTAMVTKSAGDSGQKDCLIIAVRNLPRQLLAYGKDGSPITGIPYDYSELVFDLFFTMESFTTENSDEEWPDGTGLYVCRKLLARMGALIGNSAVVDYTGSKPEPMVQFTVAFPLKRG
jgi:DNA-binding response OmpR family regulator